MLCVIRPTAPGGKILFGSLVYSLCFYYNERQGFYKFTKPLTSTRHDSGMRKSSIRIFRHVYSTCQDLFGNFHSEWARLFKQKANWK